MTHRDCNSKFDEKREREYTEEVCERVRGGEEKQTKERSWYRSEMMGNIISQMNKHFKVVCFYSNTRETRFECSFLSFLTIF